jgi:hypothetical protein
MTSSLVRPLSVVALVLAASSTAAAQVNQPANMKEYGLDAGLTVGLGDVSSVNIDVPTARARIGFFMNNDSRWSLEPAIGLSYNKTENADGVLTYNLEGGALYHFAAPQALAGTDLANAASVFYARPFVNITGYTGDDGDSEVSVGGGLGVKIPWRAGLAWRLEGNAGYGFDNEALRLGAFAGLSFFTR